MTNVQVGCKHPAITRMRIARKASIRSLVSVGSVYCVKFEGKIVTSMPFIGPTTQFKSSLPHAFLRSNFGKVSEDIHFVSRTALNILLPNYLHSCSYQKKPRFTETEIVIIKRNFPFSADSRILHNIHLLYWYKNPSRYLCLLPFSMVQSISRTENVARLPSLKKWKKSICVMWTSMNPSSY